MKILCWNVRGINSRSKLYELKKLLASMKVTYFVFLRQKLKRARLQTFSNPTSLDGIFLTIILMMGQVESGYYSGIL